MCGIIGLFALGELKDEQEKIRQESMMYLSTELLQLTQTRGKDATGISVLFENSDYMGLKMGISAIEFVSRFGGKETDYEGFMKLWRKKASPAKIFIGHCRKPSIGKSVINNVNNHPIKVGDIVGIHNGTLDNHDIIFKNLDRKPDGEVDSEAIFQLLHYLTHNGTDPFTLEILEETCKRLEGPYACLAFNGNNPFQVVAFRDTRPINLALIRPLNIVIATSDSDFIKTALFRFNILARVYNCGIALPTIHKCDVDLEVLTDDTAYLLDLTKNITKTTPLSLLYDYRKIVRADKIWKSKTNYNCSQNVYNRTQFNVNAKNRAQLGDMGVEANKAKAPETKTTESTAKYVVEKISEKDEDSTKKNVNDALLWNNATKVYDHIDVDSSIEEKDIGDLTNMFINIETEEITTIDQKTVRSPKRGSTNASKVVTEIIQKRKRTFLLNETEAEKEWVDEEDTKTAVDIMDFSSYNKDCKIPIIKKCINMSALEPLGIEAAAEASQSLERFSTDDEVCQALTIHDHKNLKSLPIYSLANRIIKFTTERSFLEGWKSAIENSDQLKHLVPSDDKKRKAEQGIRVAKSLINIISNANIYKSNEAYTQRMDEEITKALEDHKEINSEMLLKIFSVDDLRKNNILRHIQSFLIRNGK